MLDTTVILQISGFVVCFILLFVFTAKYRGALAHETDFESSSEEVTVATTAVQPTFKPRASLLSSLQGSSSLEVADLKEKVKELQYRLEEMKIGHDKMSGDLSKQIARMETRIGTFEEEYVTKLQPTLLSLIQELENMKVAESKK
ncbi:hypothetical protein [Candidatus Avelusimicrobium caledoniensis]|uniref:hypothetical protein n=1 Tax=Candidatus Avelusimicrobium caledoniensis TaxID=3416220 RepID=UPI003D0ED8B6